MSSSPLRLAPRYHCGDRRCNWKAWRRATAGPAALDRMPACRSVADGDGDRARGPEGRDDRGMFARPSGDDHHEVVRAGAERHVLREEPSPEALGVDHPEALAILRTEAVEPHAGALPDRPLDVGLGPARVRERSRVLWAEDDERLTAEIDVVAPRRRRGSRDGEEDRLCPRGALVAPRGRRSQERTSRRWWRCRWSPYR